MLKYIKKFVKSLLSELGYELRPIRIQQNNYNLIKDIRKKTEHKFSNRQVVLLVDSKTPFVDNYRIINMELEDVSVLENVDFDKTIFVFASEYDYISLPWCKTIMNKNGKYVGIGRQYLSGKRVAMYRNIDFNADKTLNEELLKQTNERYAKWNEEDFNNITQAINLTHHVSGDFVEVGCYRGSSGSIALNYINRSGMKRRCWFLDVFEGFNYLEAEKSPDAHWHGTHQTEGFEIVQTRLKQYERFGKIAVNVVKLNIVTEGLPDSIKNIALANIDVDMYEPTLMALEKVFPKLVNGSIIIAQDPGRTPRLLGARLALEEFLSKHRKELLPIYMESGQTFILRLKT